MLFFKWRVGYKQYEIIKLLTERSESLGITRPMLEALNFNAFWWVCINNDWATLDLLLTKADVLGITENMLKSGGFKQACEKGNLAVVKLLLREADALEYY